SFFRQARRVWKVPRQLQSGGALTSPFHPFAPYFLNQRRGGVPQIDEIDIVRNRASLDRLRKCSLMGQGRRLDVSDIDACGCLRSLRAHVALDGVSWVRSGSVEIAVGQRTACYRIGAVICSLPRASLRSGARFDLLFGECCSATPV